VQLHTASSFDVKQNKTHVAYEKFRAARDLNEKYAYFLDMKALFDTIVIPKDVSTIGIASNKYVSACELFSPSLALCSYCCYDSC
jgi:hypothetical protein